MLRWFVVVYQQLKAAWASVQVEFQGSYSIGRIQQLESYTSDLSKIRLLLLLLITPLPCLALSLLKELPPLKPIEAGVVENWVFFVRGWFVMAVVGGSLPVQIGQWAPRLKMPARQVIFIASFASAVAMVMIGVLCELTVFSVPFGVLVVAMPDTILISLYFIWIFRPKWQADPSLWTDFKRYLPALHCQLSLTMFYPLYAYGFVSLSGINRALFVLLLPLIKLLAKNWMSRALGDRGDLKPEEVIFTAEVFNALYVSNALQSGSSWTSIIIIMTADLIDMCVSLLDVVKVFKEVKALMKKIPRNHSIANETFVQVALTILAVDSNSSENSNRHKWRNAYSTSLQPMISFPSSDDPKATAKSRSPTVAETSFKLPENAGIWRIFRSAQVVPKAHKQTAENTLTTTDANIDVKAIYSRGERDMFIRKSAHVLFITEYIVLMEYVEVVLPFIYCRTASLINFP